MDCSFSENDKMIYIYIYNLYIYDTLYILTKISLMIIPDGSLTCTWIVKLKYEENTTKDYSKNIYIFFFENLNLVLFIVLIFFRRIYGNE